MYKHTIKDEVPLKTAFNWSLLAFLAGCVNAGGFFACSRFVTHLTGFGTYFGIDIEEGNYLEAFGIAAVPVFFIAGAMTAALLVDRRIAQEKEPRYDIAMLLVAICLILAALGGQFGLFGRFGDVAKMKTDFIFLVLLCGASGIQNAAITSASKGSVRTTHLTGISTDLGIGLVKLLYTDLDDRKNWIRRFRVQAVRVATITAFIGGSVVGAYLFVSVEYLGFLYPAAIALWVTYVAWDERSHHKDSGLY